jgi:hypothetical protein
MMLAGRPPFEGPSFADYFRQHLEQEPVRLESLSPSVNRGLADVLTKALAKSPQERWSTPTEMLAAMRPYTEESTRLVTEADMEQTVFSDRLTRTSLAPSSIPPTSVPQAPAPRTSVSPVGAPATAAVATPQPGLETVFTPSTRRAIPQSQPQSQPGDPFAEPGETVAVRPAPASIPIAGGRFPLWMVAAPVVLLIVVLVVVIFVLLRPAPTPEPRPTAVPTPPNVATQQASGTPIPKGVLFEDPLNDLSKGKLLKASDKPAAYYVGYGNDYTIQKLTPDVASAVAVSVPGSFVDTDTAVDARVVDPADNRWVFLSCRDQGSANSGYQFRVLPSSGLASIVRTDGGANTTLVGPQSAPSLKRGQEVNRIEFQCQGANLTGRINGEDAVSTTDIAYRDGGVLLGVAADTSGGNPATIESHFKNLVVNNP